jgi:hypothetical protein
MISEICPVTGEYCFKRDALAKLDLRLEINKPKQAKEFHNLREDVLCSLVEQGERACSEEYCGIDGLATAISLRNLASEIAEHTMNSSKWQLFKG